jgi:uncharacterized protein YcfJ
MKSAVLVSAIGALAVWGGAANAQENTQEFGRVISSTPVIQQVAVPRQVCSNQPVAVQQPNSGAGAVMGGIAGGALGNQIGHGSGRAAATALGLIGGALLGNNIEGSGTQVQNVQQCSTQTTYENRTVAYNVTYEYAGKQYNVQMPNDPGPTIALQVTPAGSQPQASTDFGNAAPAGTAIGVIVGQPVAPVGYSAAYPVYAPAPAYYPGYYPGYVYPPISLSLGFGFSGGHHGGFHHRHFR